MASHISSFTISFLSATAGSSSPFSHQLHSTTSVNNLIRTSQGVFSSSWFFKCCFWFQIHAPIHSCHLRRVPHTCTSHLVSLQLLLTCTLFSETYLHSNCVSSPFNGQSIESLKMVCSTRTFKQVDKFPFPTLMIIVSKYFDLV